MNGEAIYGTRPWTRYGEGPYHDAPAADARGADDPPAESYTSREFRFTIKGSTLYAMVMDWPENRIADVSSLASGKVTGAVTKVELLGHSGELQFNQDALGLKVNLPANRPCDAVFVLKVTGLKMQ